MAPVPDWLSVVAALALLGARHLWTLLHSAELKASTALREAWVRRVLAQPGAEILAVQTVRNSIMASTLMATTAALALMGLITIGHSQMRALAALPAGDAVARFLSTPEIRLILPLGLLAACIVLFSGAVRLYHRVSYSLGLPKGASELHAQAEQAALAEIARAARLYRHGWRAFYAAIATGAWLVSGAVMLITTVVIVAIDIAARIE
ncbi:MAG: DUF599 domain-containing protein [Burkholderiales bacterium]|nr:DUF599 domain-containing protein [Burkholderiales bacterium]